MMTRTTQTILFTLLCATFLKTHSMENFDNYSSRVINTYYTTQHFENELHKRVAHFSDLNKPYTTPTNGTFSPFDATFLTQCIYFRHNSLLKILIEKHQLHLHYYGNTPSPLHIAICNENLIATRLLIENGADVNHPETYGDNQYSRPLNFAFNLKIDNEDRKELVQMLLEHGADPNLTCSSNLPALASLASSRNIYDHDSIRFAQLLLDHGAKPWCKILAKNEKWTLTALANAFNKPILAQFLKNKGFE